MSEKVPIALVSTYPPRECGIATYTAHLREGIQQATSSCVPVAAISHYPNEYHYPSEVWWELLQDKRSSYQQLATTLTRDERVAAVGLQHEFGIYGGKDGEYVLDFVERLGKPLIVTLHTILSQPSSNQRRIILGLCHHANAVVVMARKGVELLEKVYGVPQDKVKVIPHGLPSLDYDQQTRADVKTALGLQGNVVLCTFGLISRGKGIETVIEALPRIVARHPQVRYLILGKTHPEVVRQEGETYRMELQERVRQLGLDAYVEFVDRYLDEEELVRYLLATDIYVTPYLAKEQITSGTLTYAMGLGKVVISTPYWHAEELLGEGRGVLVPFRDEKAVADAVNALIERPQWAKEIGSRARKLGKSMEWPRVGERYLELAEAIQAQRRNVGVEARVR